MKIIGLTGGIASGKSTVQKMLELEGATVLDADHIYHQLTAPNDGVASPLAEQIGRRFFGVLKSGGELDRRKLGERVFSRTDERRALEQLTHPAIAQETGRRMQELREQGLKIAIYSAPLLYERHLDEGMDGVIVVWVPEEIELQRLCERDHLDLFSAKQRLRAQLPLEEKKQRATWIIDNSKDLSNTEQQVKKLWQTLCGL